MGMMSVMDQVEGDIRVNWNPENGDETEAARATFDRMVGSSKRFRAYKVDRTGGQRTGEPITAFDPDAEELLLVPPMAGGDA